MATDGSINIEDVVTSRRRLDFEFVGNNQGVEDDSNIDDDDDGEKLIQVRHTTIPNEKIPKIGLEFDTELDAYNVYNDYAKAAGFSIRKDVAHKSRGRILDRIYQCSCEGQRKVDKRDAAIRSHRPQTRYGCQAMMKVNVRQTGRYKIEKFIASHNGHGLVSPDKSHMLRSHRKVTSIHALQADDMDSSGIKPKAGFELLAKQAGGRENLGIIFEDYKNYLRSSRTREMEIDDTGGVLKHLQERQSEDSNFFYAIQIDKDHLIANIFWADARMRSDYIYFGDVLCFDTTHRKNREDCPFALFVGVNHHKQTTIFGAALLYDETADTFMWLFDTFSRAMSGKKPETILTDQDAAMAKALALKWPDTYHRLCIWHIYQNAASNLKEVFGSFTDFATDFSSCIYDYEEEDDFLLAWQMMLEKYKLQENAWVMRLFGIREKWALVYGRQAFFGDMTTTQRSESMNNALTKYVSCNTNILQFFKHFRRMVDDRRYQELKADLWNSQSTIELSFPVAILKHARGFYTHEVFLLFQRELSKGYDSTIELCTMAGDISEYKITPFHKPYNHKVRYNSATSEVSCSYKKFEFAGILCSHVLKMFTYENISRIPEIYIKKRWKKKAKKGLIEGLHTFLDDKQGEPMNEADETKMIGVHSTTLGRLYYQILPKTSLTPKTFGILRDAFLKASEDIDTSLEKRDTTKSNQQPKSLAKSTVVSRVLSKETLLSGPVEQHMQGKIDEFGTTDGDDVIIRGLKCKEKKPRRSGKRLMSGLEQATRKRKPKSNATSAKGMSNGVPNLNIVSSNNHCASVEACSLPLLPELHVLQQTSQEYQDGVSALNMYYPTQGHSTSHMEPLQDAQFNIASFYSKNNQHMIPSLTQLLQEQISRKK